MSYGNTRLAKQHGNNSRWKMTRKTSNTIIITMKTTCRYTQENNMTEIKSIRFTWIRQLTEVISRREQEIVFHRVCGILGVHCSKRFLTKCLFIPPIWRWKFYNAETLQSFILKAYVFPKTTICFKGKSRLMKRMLSSHRDIVAWL